MDVVKPKAGKGRGKSTKSTSIWSNAVRASSLPAATPASSAAGSRPGTQNYYSEDVWSGLEEYTSGYDTKRVKEEPMDQDEDYEPEEQLELPGCASIQVGGKTDGKTQLAWSQQSCDNS